jgi:hypothetical protein
MVEEARRRRALQTVVLVVVAELALAATAHRFDPVLRHHAWLALLPPAAAQALRRPGTAGAAPVVAAFLGALLGALFLVALGDRTRPYAAWLPPACAAAAGAAGLLHRRFHGLFEPTRLESRQDPEQDRTVAEE